MATFFYRVRGTGPIELAATRAPAGPWLDAIPEGGKFVVGIGYVNRIELA